jgi:hypothetical protein
MKLPERVVVGDDDSQGDALVRMAKVYEDRGDYAMAVSAYREAEREFGQRPDREMCAAEARRCATEINKGMHSKDEGTVTWKTLPKPVAVNRGPLQSVALRPGEEKEVYRPRTDKELSSSFGKDDARGMTSIELRDEIRAVRSQISGSAGIMLKRENPERYKQLESRLTDLLDASSYRSKDALPLPVPVKDDRPPLGGLKCQKCGKSVSEKTRQLGGPPLCALHRAIASGSGKDAAPEKIEIAATHNGESIWKVKTAGGEIRYTPHLSGGLYPTVESAKKGLDKDKRRYAKDTAPRYKPTDCIYNPPS